MCVFMGASSTNTKSQITESELIFLMIMNKDMFLYNKTK